MRRYKVFMIVGLASSVLLALAVTAIVLAGASAAEETQAAQILTRPLPTDWKTAQLTVHMQRRVEDIAVPGRSWKGDFWYDGPSKRFRQESGRLGAGQVTVRAFSGKEYWGYDVESNRAFRYSLAGLARAPYSKDLDPLDADRNLVARQAEYINDGVLNGRLVLGDRIVVDGRQMDQYEMLAGDPGNSTVGRLLVDTLTGLPQSEEMIDASGTLTGKGYWDYEVLDLTAEAIDSLFAPSIPAGMIPREDEDLEIDATKWVQDPWTAANTSKFTLVWLGEKYAGLPLERVSKPRKDGSIEIVYRAQGGTPEAVQTGFESYILEEYDSNQTLADVKPGLTDPLRFEGPSGPYEIYTDATTGNPLALVTTRHGTLIVITQVMKPTRESLAVAAESLVEVPNAK